MAFDTLAYAKKLQEGGFTAQQAEVQTEALRMALEQELATKQDIQSLRLELKQDIENLRQEMRREIEKLRHEMKEMEARLRADMAEMETRLLVRLGAITIGGITVLGVFLGALIALAQ